MSSISKPTRYLVLLDEIDSSSNDLQDLTNSLLYMYQRGTSVILHVDPICYTLSGNSNRTVYKVGDNSETYGLMEDFLLHKKVQSII